MGEAQEPTSDTPEGRGMESVLNEAPFEKKDEGKVTEIAGQEAKTDNQGKSLESVVEAVSRDHADPPVSEKHLAPSEGQEPTADGDQVRPTAKPKAVKAKAKGKSK